MASLVKSHFQEGNVVSSDNICWANLGHHSLIKDREVPHGANLYTDYIYPYVPFFAISSSLPNIFPNVVLSPIS